MRMTLKRLTAWMLTLMMVIGCVPAYAADGNVVDYSDSTSAFDIMPLDDSASESVTVTFVINNSNYTNDPGSQTTHITAKAPIEGGELTYTKWAGRYKVTGTGTVCSYSIPAGTSLSDTECALPALTVENIGNTNTYSYSSVQTWITADGMVCSSDTVFTEDTTLYLQLYVTGSTIYSLDFVCSEENHSIKSVGSFLLGQSISQAHIDAATEAANAFESQWCSYGPASNQRLQKWQLKKTATGEMVDLSAGMAITEEYVNSQYGTAVKVYAVWEENTSTPVTATFQYDVTVDGTTTTQTADTRTLNAGDALGELPDMTAHTPEGSTFIGWQYTAADGSLQYATAETVITADTVFTAVFGTQVTATFQYENGYDEETGEPVYETIAVRTLNAGDALGELPDVTEYETAYFVFDSWQYTDAEGNEQTATAETIIMEDTVYTAVFAEVPCGNVVIHDILPDGTESGVVLDFSVPEGMTLAGAIAENDEDIEEGKLLSECVWRTAVNGELADMNAVVVAGRETHLYTHTYQIVLKLNLNTVSPAAFTSRTRASVDPSTAEDGTVTMTITAREGEKLTENDFIVNGTDLTQYAWTDGSGNAINLRSLIDEGVTGSITATSDGTLAATDLTLTLVLTLDGETKTYTITKAEGETFAASDFVIDGLDLTVFTWTGDQGAVSLTSLVDHPLTADTALTSDGSLASTLDTDTDQRVNFYVFIDNKPVRIASKTVTAYISGNRRYLSAATLASVYGEFGFNASDLKEGTHYFPHVDAGGTNLWGDTPVLLYDGLYFSPITNNGSIADVYYIPTQSITEGDVSYTGHINANSFYTVTVVDSMGVVYGAGEVPDVTYTLAGHDAEVTVDTPDGIQWQYIGSDGTVITVAPVEGANTTTITIENIAQPYKVKPVVIPRTGSVVVKYDMNLPETPADTEYGTPKVNGKEDYFDVLETANANAYTVLAPNPSSYFYKNDKYLGEVTFLGWAVNGNTSELVQPNEQLNLSEYNGQTVTLTAQWETEIGGKFEIWNSPMLNFFVSLEAVSEGTTAWVGSTETKNFTQSVYTTDSGVTGSQVYSPKYDDYGNIVVEQHIALGGTSGTNLNDNHDLIVSELTEGHTHTNEVNGNQYTATATFPSDETVLRNVRRMVENGDTTIQINDREIQSSELTSTNFTIKWYVYKFDTSDGWHIDGILVAKTGEMVVTKTFAGDDDAIAAVKENYSIGVEGGSGYVHPGETLTTSNADSQSDNTYTWKVPVDQYYDYTITENNYAYTEKEATYKARYRVRHSNTSSQNTGWTNYNSGFTVTGRGYNETDDERLTVDFLNTYTAAGTVIVQKIDAATGNLMPNVSFTIDGTRSSDNSTLQMYDLGGSHYTADATKGGTATSTITTDASGQAYLWIGGGTYTLTEEVPTGYDDPGVIRVELQGDAGNAYKVVKITSLFASNDTDERDFTATAGEGDLTLIVRNYSRTIDLVVEKNWPDQENAPVTISLYRNGRPMGEAYTVRFDRYVGGTASHTFTGLPLYADGDLAQYKLSEEKIGEFMYSTEYDDGYRYYDVTKSQMQYLDESGSVTRDMTAVKTIKLSVSNERSNGTLSIEKTDETDAPLGGAEFYLYAAPSGTDAPPDLSGSAESGYTLSGDPIMSAISAANGTVSFANLSAGRYYLIEHMAPTGYTGSTNVYELQFDGDRAAMRYWDGDSWETTALKVTNESRKADKTVTKIWEDGNDAAGMRPDSITLTLTGKVGDTVAYTQSRTLTAAELSDVEMDFATNTATASNRWTYVFTDVPLYSGGEEITYTVSEEAVPGYTTEYDQSTLTVTNTLGVTNVTITKQITGNFGDPNAAFPFTAVVTVDGKPVILDADAGYTVAEDGTISFSLSDNGSVTIRNVPMQAIVTVSETPGVYSASYQIGSAASQTGEQATLHVANGERAVTFTNDRTITVDTGINLDGLPYMLLLLGAAGIAIVWMLLLGGTKKDD